MQFIKLFLSTLIYVLALDMIWLQLIAKKLYANSLGSLLRQPTDFMASNWTAAFIVYVLIAVGVIFFVLPKASGHYAQAFIWGAAFGLIMYGIFDFTNYSIIANWPLNITLIDLVWGMVLCGMTSTFATFAQKWLNS